MISLTNMIMLSLLGGVMGYIGGGWKRYRGISMKIAIVNLVISLMM